MRFVAAALAALALLPSCAAAAPGLLLGVDDDSLKWYGHTGSLLSIYRSLNLGAVRVTLSYPPDRAERTEMQRVAQAARTTRVVVAVTGAASAPPLDDPSRQAFCSYVAGVLRRVPSVHDVAIWTEPNSSTFWQPQKGAAAAYEGLLATCWDTLHAVQPSVNVIATSAPHAKPGHWYEQLGKAYRASARLLPIFDTVGHNAYPETSSEAPGVLHKTGSIDQGDLDRLLAALREGFAKTGQPLPGQRGVTVWYLEDGFQTAIDPGKAPAYRDTENAPRLLPALSPDGDQPHPADTSLAPDQATQLTDALSLAYCQPGVGAFFNFMLADEPDLGGWQSGVLWADWSQKASYAAFHDAIQQVHAGTVNCASLKGGSAGGTQATLAATTRKPG